MTFIAGIASPESCAITAENMVMADRPIRTGPGISSSGRALSLDMNDSAFKLFNPRANCIVGLAGNPDRGLAIIDQIKSTDGLDTYEALCTFLSDRPPSRQKRVTLIIGIFDESLKSTHMLKWSSETPAHVEEGSFLCAGSGTAYLRDMPKELVREILSTRTAAATKGAMLSFYFNQKLFHRLGKSLHQVGVGGCFFSFGLDGDHFESQEDTAILRVELIPSKQMIHVPVVTLAFRRGVFFVNSAVSGVKNVLMNSVDCPDDVREAIDALREKRLKEFPYENLGFDLEEIWGLASVRNVEIHFESDKIPSKYIACAPGELLELDDTKTTVTVKPQLQEEIQELITATGAPA
ncbi:hypothetical protein LCGC14_0987320 [marine sediment metagenome]|uniref:Uncharacterized protein n=1 Tax=marine sediment metagenome TaxID=412755 RepID=A0A0F9N6V3_9ZZZZ